MKMAPTTWFATSSTEPKPSQRNVLVRSAMAADPATMPSTPAMPKVSTRDASVHSTSNSSRYATGATKLYDSIRPELVATNFSSSVAGSSARNPRRPDTYPPPTITAPTTSPPTTSSPAVRKSRLAKQKAPTANATTNGSHSFAPASPHDAATVPRSDVGAPTSKRSGSRPLARHGANAPFSVMYAATARNTRTMSDFRLPA